MKRQTFGHHGVLAESSMWLVLRQRNCKGHSRLILWESRSPRAANRRHRWLGLTETVWHLLDK